MAKILLIEDDSILREMYQDQFKKVNFEVITAQEGKIGLIEAAKEKPDFILLDLMMPAGMDGPTTLRHLKEMEQTKDIPVAILTVVPEAVPKEITETDLKDQIVDYWQKDKYDPSDVVRKISEYLSESPQTTT